MRGGMSVWMQAWAQCVVQVPASPKERLGEDEVVPLEMHQEVTMSVAAMVLKDHQRPTPERSKPTTASATPICMFANRRYAKCSRTREIPAPFSSNWVFHAVT
jgi:hypothetical protein